MANETAAEKAARIKKEALNKKLEGSGFVVPTVDSSKTPNNTNTTKTTQYFKKIDVESARTLLEKAMADSQYAGKLDSKAIAEFIKEFNDESEKQAKTISALVQSRLKPGATAEDIAKATQTAITTEFPSYFSATSFSKDFIWKKINFKDKTAGANAIAKLQDVKNIAESYGSNAMAPAQLENYALQIAKGSMTIDDFKAIMQPIGVKNYPQFAEAFKQNPNLSMYDLAGAYINQMAKTLELDPNSIKLDNLYLDKALRPDGTAGTLPAQSLGDFNMALMGTKDYQYTQAANQGARDAATGLAHAMGMGV